MKRLLFTLVLFLSTLFAFSQVKSNDTIYRNLSLVQADSLINAYGSDTNFVILDVRTATEFNNGHLINAININYYAPNFSAFLDALDHNKAYLIYCASGSRSGATFTSMQNKHFREVYNMLGGYNAWSGAGYPTNLTVSIQSMIRPDATIRVFPNPFVQEIDITLPPDLVGSFSVQLLSPDGHMIFERIKGADADRKIHLDVEPLASGAYFLVVTGTSYRVSIQVIRAD